MKRRAIVTATLTPVGVLGVAGVALAFWTVSSSGALGSAAADALGTPTVSTSGVSASNVTINVTAAPTTGPTPTSYRVDRTAPGATVVGVCSISGATGHCDDPSPVGGSTNSYAVYGLLGTNWVGSAAGSASASVPSSDTTPPVTVATPSPAANGAGWNHSNVTLTLAATDNVGGSGVQQVVYSASGAQVIGTTTIAGSSTNVTISAEGPTTLSFHAADNAGNVESTKTVSIQLDKTGPSNVLSLMAATGNSSFLRSGTIYYNGNASGSVKLSNGLTDSRSGPASSATATLTGSAAGWTHDPSSVATPAGGPYVSNAFSWVASTTTAPSETVTGNDVAGNATPSTLAFADDEAGPTGGSISYASTISSGTSASISFSGGTDAGAGLNAAVAKLQRSMASYTGGVCGVYGGFSDLMTAPSSPYSDSSLGDGCYKYQYLAFDNLGNVSTNSSANVLVVDTGVPTVTVNQKSGQADPTNTAPMLWTVTFSESVTGFDATDVTRTGSSSGGAVSVTGSGASYEISLASPTLNGTTTFTVASGRAVDLAGNANAASTSSDNTVTYDTVAPTVTVNQKSGQADPTNTAPMLWTVTFSESVTGFDATDVTRTGSSSGGAVSVTGSGASYEISLASPTLNGTTTFTVASGRAVDLAGNANAASTSSDNTITYDNVAPTVSLAVIAPATAGRTLDAGLFASSVYFNDCQSGSGFRLVATVTDGSSTSTTYPGLSASRWTTHASETVTAPTGGPFTSSDFLFSANNCSGGKAAVPSNYTVSVTDASGNTSSITLGFVADHTAPGVATSGVGLTNGGTAGTADANDTITVNYSETMDAASFCATWINNELDQSTSATVSISAADVVSVSAPGCTFSFGTVSLANYNTNASSARTFTGTLTWSPSSNSLQVKLTSAGTGGTAGTSVANAVPSYSATTSLQDFAHNSLPAGPYAGTSSRL